MDVKQLLDKFGPQKVVETGHTFTLEIAEWTSLQWRGTAFQSIGMSPEQLDITREKLEKRNLSRYCTLRLQYPNKFLSAATWIDAVFLTPTDLQDGLEQFSLAMSAGIRLAVIPDYQNKGGLAVKKARELGWQHIVESFGSVLLK